MKNNTQKKFKSFKTTQPRSWTTAKNNAYWAEICKSFDDFEKNRDKNQPCRLHYESEIETQSKYYEYEAEHDPDHYTFINDHGKIYKLDNYTHTFESTFNII